MNLDVIITGGWDRIGYNVLRSLSKAGLKVGFGVDENSGMGVYSNIHPDVFRYTAYSKDENLFINNIIDFIKISKPLVYLPTGEEAFIIAKHINMFDNLEVKIPISSYKVLSKLHSKKESFHLAKSLGIPTPETIIPVSVNEIIEFGIKNGYPIVAKSFFSSSAKGVVFLQEKNLKDQLEKLLKSKKIIFGQFLIQQYVRGDGYGVSMLFNKGELKALFTHKRIRERIVSGGPSTLRMSTHNSQLEDYAVNLLKSLNYHGVAMVEFKYNEKEKKIWLMEVNPRFWGSVGLAIYSGINFPYLLYKCAIDEKVDLIKNYKTDLKYKWILGNISGIVNQIISTKNPLFLKNLFDKVDGYDDFYIDDPMPFFAIIYLIFKRFLRNKLHKIIS